MSDTPRTDEELVFRYDEYRAESECYVDADFARQLERENQEMRMQLDQMDDERLSWKHEAEKRGEALAELRRDKERLDWLEETKMGIAWGGDPQEDDTVLWSWSIAPDPIFRGTEREELRAAIDAAMNNKETKDDETSNQI